MAITVEEKFKGRSGSDTKRSVTYLVRGTDSDSEAIAQTITHVTTGPDVDGLAGYWDGLQLESVSATQLGDDIFATVAEYGQIKKPDPPATGSVNFDFSYSASSEHINYSISTKSISSVSGITALDFKNAINVVSDSGHLRVEGIDAPNSPVTHTWTYYPADGAVTSTYQEKVLGMMGHVNNAAFNGAAAGEVRFVGCSGGARNSEDWQIRFEFSYIKNQTSMAIGEITGISKEGHDIVWVLFDEKLDSNDFLVKVPAVAYVEQIFPRSNLASLFT